MISEPYTFKCWRSVDTGRDTALSVERRLKQEIRDYMVYVAIRDKKLIQGDLDYETTMKIEGITVTLYVGAVVSMVDYDTGG